MKGRLETQTGDKDEVRKDVEGDNLGQFVITEDGVLEVVSLTSLSS